MSEHIYSWVGFLVVWTGGVWFILYFALEIAKAFLELLRKYTTMGEILREVFKILVKRRKLRLQEEALEKADKVEDVEG